MTGYSNQSLSNSSLTYSENLLQEHDEDVDPSTAKALSIAAVVLAAVAIPAFLFFLSKMCCSDSPCVKLWLDPLNNFLYQELAIVSILVALLLFVLVSSLAFVYSDRLQERDSLDYQGQMRVVDLQYKERLREWTTSNGNTRTKHYERYYDAHFTLDWGYGWACPSHGNVQCKASDFVYCSERICRSKSCSQGDHDRAWDKIVECASNVYNPNMTYTPFDPFTGPSNDKDWPSVIAYGNCGNCDVQGTVTGRTSLKRIRYAVWGTVGALSFVVCGIFVAWIIYRCRRQTRANKHKAMAKKQTTAAVSSVVPMETPKAKPSSYMTKSFAAGDESSTNEPSQSEDLSQRSMQDVDLEAADNSIAFASFHTCRSADEPNKSPNPKTPWWIGMLEAPDTMPNTS